MPCVICLPLLKAEYLPEENKVEVSLQPSLALNPYSEGSYMLDVEECVTCSVPQECKESDQKKFIIEVRFVLILEEWSKKCEVWREDLV